MNKTIITFALVGIFSLIAGTQVYAGTLFPPTGSQPGETMYSLQEIYNLVTASTTSNIGDGSSFETPVIVGNTGSMITLTELYNAVLALKNAGSVVDTNNNDDTNDNATTTPVVPEDLTDHSNISVELKMTSSANLIRFEVTATDKALYIVQNQKIENIVVGTSTTPILTVAPGVYTQLVQYSSFDTESFDPQPLASAVGGYFVIPAGTTGIFMQSIKKSDGQPYSDIKVGFDALEYKVASPTAGLRVFDLDQNEFNSITR
jgi:hypothetical protein